MRKLGNVLYVTTPEAWVALEGETVVLKKEEGPPLQIPLHNLEAIVCFNYPGVSPALMGACAERNIGLCFLRPSGRFLARVTGKEKGNLLLRKLQYGAAEQTETSTAIARSAVLGKILNCRIVLERALRDHALLLNVERVRGVSALLRTQARAALECATVGSLRGIEGSAAAGYFGVFGELVLQQRNDFAFTTRTRRPPQDKMNALLSFLYTLLTTEVASALETEGLDPYVGFLHADRPGRPSLALDMMEELRPVLADRLALSLVNRRQVSGAGFVRKESGGFLMDDATRKEVITAWQKRKQEEVVHPYLKEKIPLGLVAHVQARLLARHLRGDSDAYPPFIWR